MNIYQWLCLFGVPAIVSGLVAYMVKQWMQIKALKLGLQALLRAELLKEYRAAKHDGYTRVSDRESWQNMYNQYHTLGANGVMDDIKKRYFALPEREDNDE